MAPNYFLPARSAHEKKPKGFNQTGMYLPSLIYLQLIIYSPIKMLAIAADDVSQLRWRYSKKTAKNF